MVSNPEFYARIIHRGLQAYFTSFDRSDVVSLVPKVFGMYTTGENGSRAHIAPDHASEVIQTLQAGVVLRPVDETDEWYEVGFRSPFRIGWIAKADLTALSNR